MAKITNLQLAECFGRYLAEKRGYVYGLTGELYSKEMAEARMKGGYSVPSGKNRETYFTVECARWFGIRCADCSGGIVGAIREHDSTYKLRPTADGFRAAFTESGEVKTIPEIPGLAVWKSGHIGVYIGAGEVIEFEGTNYGCTKTRLANRGYTHWGKLADVDYTAQTDNSPQPEPKPPVVTPQEPFYAVCTGNDVNVRAGCSSSTASLHKAYKGDKMLALPAVEKWHEIAIYTGKGMLSGYMFEDYVKGVKAV